MIHHRVSLCDPTSHSSRATEYFTLNLYNLTIDRRGFATVVQSAINDVILNLDELKTKDIFMFGKIF